MKNEQINGINRAFTALLLIIAANMAPAQVATGGAYSLDQSVIAGGGTSAASGASQYGIEGTIGQAIAGGALAGSALEVSSGFWTAEATVPTAPTYEGDVGSRPTGDGAVQSNDVTQTQRFEIGLDRPFQSNEFQRADSAPFSSRGDGRIDSADTTQAQRYEIGLDPRQLADGPTSSTENIARTNGNDEEAQTGKHTQSMDLFARAVNNTAKFGGSPRELRVESTTSSAGQTVIVNIRVDAVSDESGYGFTLNYNNMVLTAPSVAIGTAGGSRNCNLTVAGQIRCSVRNFDDNNPVSSTDQIGEIMAGANQLLVKITFTVASGAMGGATDLTLSNVNASNDLAQSVAISSRNGSISISGPTAANVSVSGRVITATGRGITNVIVILKDSTGNERTARTTSFGYYRFDDVTAGETVTLSAKAKRFRFIQATIVRTTSESIGDADFVSQQ